MDREFKIPFVGLKLGTHYYDYIINDAFFARLDYSLIKKGSVLVNLELLKQESMMILTFSIDGKIIDSCDTCLADVEIPLQGQNKLIVKLSDEAYDGDDDEVLVIPRHEFELDVAQYIYEFITILRPLKIVPPENCEENGLCDMEVKKRLAGTIENNANSEEVEDPRWQELKKLFNKN